MEGECDASRKQRRKQLRSRKRVAHILVVLAVLFVVCWSPLNVYTLIIYYGNIDMTAFLYYFKMGESHDLTPLSSSLRPACPNPLAVTVAYCLQFANSCTNPIALYFLSTSYHRYYRLVMTCNSNSAAVNNNSTLASRSHH